MLQRKMIPPKKCLTKPLFAAIIYQYGMRVNTMNLELKKYFAGQHDTFRFVLDLSGLELGGVKPFCAPVQAEAEIGGFAGAVRLSLRVEYTVSMPCDRCGKQTEKSFRREFVHLLVRQLSDEQESATLDEEYIVVPDEQLDLDELLREDILLDLPTKYLCRDDCKGLCPKCGKDLNEGDCGCDRREIDPRLEILKSLLN